MMNFCPAVTLTVVVELSLFRTVVEKFTKKISLAVIERTELMRQICKKIIKNQNGNLI